MEKSRVSPQVRTTIEAGMSASQAFVRYGNLGERRLQRIAVIGTY
ncbi:MAG TPA: hypothetical protein VMT34_05760 [Aggregatilineales bacterium]|nr:hypothetical protein [Aggregatilineales bacterium]